MASNRHRAIKVPAGLDAGNGPPEPKSASISTASQVPQRASYLQPATRSAVWPVGRASNLAITLCCPVASASISLFLSHLHQRLTHSTRVSLAHPRFAVFLFPSPSLRLNNPAPLINLVRPNPHFFLSARAVAASRRLLRAGARLCHPSLTSLTRRCLSGLAADSTGARAAIHVPSRTALASTRILRL